MNRAEFQSVYDECKALYAVYQSKEADLADVESKIQSAQESQLDLQELNGYLSKLIDLRRDGLLSQVIEYVSNGLQIVFDDPSITMLIDESIRNGKKYTKIGVSVNGIATWDWSAASGGLRQLTSFMLRAIFLAMSTNARFMVLDEPFSAVSPQLRENLAQMLKKMASDLDMQFFIVSHQQEITEATDALYTIRKCKTGSEFVPA